jgi:valyl-tRNA synthetase
MLIGGRRIYYSRLNNPIVFPNNYYRSKFSSKKHHQQQRGMQEESGDKTPQNANNAGGNTKVNPKKLAKLEKFKAKEAKLKEQQLQQQQKAPQQKSVQKAKGKAEVAEYVEKTPVGQKKGTFLPISVCTIISLIYLLDMSSPMADSYNPRAVESAWYAWWEQAGFLKPRLREDGSVLERGTYVVPIPPPNVTGSLHLGHALTNSIQDALIRW